LPSKPMNKGSGKKRKMEGKQGFSEENPSPPPLPDPPQEER